jgi:hypothetical protein
VGTIQKALLLQGPLGDVTRNLLDGVSSFGTAVSSIAATYNPELQNGKIRDVAANMLPRPFQAAMRAGRAEARRIETRWAELMMVPQVASPSAAMLRQEDRQRFATMKLSEKAAFIPRASFEELAAILEAGRGRFPGIPDELWEIVEHRFVEFQMVERLKTQTIFEREPTVDHPLSAGLDEAKRTEYAADAIRNYKGESDLIPAAEGLLLTVTGIVWVACELTPKLAFKLLSTGTLE